jgi:nucleotide-binding universal stress UspA family protein
MNTTSTHPIRFQSPSLAPRRDRVAHLPTSTHLAFKNILFATDFSSAAEWALPYVIEIAGQSGGTIHVAHVIQPDIYPLLPPSEWPRIAQGEKRFREEKRSELEQELQGLPYEFILAAGDVWKNLANVIKEKNIDLLILGTHGRTGLEKVLLGSVAEKIFRQATCPVLTVGPAVSSKMRHHATVELDRILYATEFSPASLAAAPYAVYVAREFGAELVLMHSIQTTETAQVEAAYQTLRDVVPAGTDLKFRPRCVVEPGAPENTILGVAARYDADLIVLGVKSTTEHPDVVTHLSCSVVGKVVAGAECPVLTIRE